MKQFFTKATVKASVWCKPCSKKTQWKIADGRPLHCEECFGKLEKQHEKSSEIVQEKQTGFNFNS